MKDKNDDKKVTLKQDCHEFFTVILFFESPGICLCVLRT